MRLRVEYLAILGLLSCNKKSEPNVGFPPAVDQLDPDDFENPLWTAVRNLLEIPAIDGSSLQNLAASLAIPSTLITDVTKSTTETNKQVAAYVAGAASQHCAEIKTPLIDINPGAAVGLSNAFEVKNGTPTALALPAKVYWMNYKLTGDSDFRNALVTVPSTDPTTAHAASAALATKSDSSGAFGYPIVMYSHAGTGGLAYEEIALSLGQLQMGHIVAAPVFPGEPLCKTYDLTTGGKSCSESAQLSPAVGSAQPYKSDSEDLLGLYECMKVFAGQTGGIATVDANGATGTENISTKILKISASVQTEAQAAGQATNSNALLALSAAAASPVTLAVGLGRGAGVTALAMARAGAINSISFSAKTDDATVTAQAGLTAAGVTPGLFSCAAIVSPHATFSAGKNRIFLDFWVRDASGLLTPDQATASDQIPGFSFIHQSIAAIRDDAALSQTEKATQISEFVKAIDATMHLTLFHGSVQNFGRVFRSKLIADTGSAGRTLAAAQGAALNLHGTKDTVADISSTQLFSSIGVTTSTSLASLGLAPGVKWLALGIEPPASSLGADGNLASGDLGHVGDISFLGGSSAAFASVTSSADVDTSSFLGKTPGDLVALWLGAQCYPSIVADAVP